tara:strand:+ start:167341 stop:167535 length:195 start_codon:yes stop_codon:yes gene_type:complete
MKNTKKGFSCPEIDGQSSGMDCLGLISFLIRFYMDLISLPTDGFMISNVAAPFFLTSLSIEPSG